MKITVKKSVKVNLELIDTEAETLTKALQIAITAVQDKFAHMTTLQTEWCRELWNKIDKALEHENYEEEIDY